ETFFEELRSKFGAKGGQVAEAYVIAHEAGHHVQNITGVFKRFNQRDNEQSIKIELQADCYAGVWAGISQDKGIILENEIDQAIDAASSVGDDRIQKKTTGTVQPESWTHGSSAQRKEYFLKGYRARDNNVCNI
ncbi:MAG: neutral zinc metallopeptidase, partial [Patescibacteria group bacterium]